MMNESGFHVGNRLEQIQIEHEQWRQKNFGDINEIDALLGIGEEFGELCHSILKQRQNIRGEITDENIKDDLGDILIFMINFCNAKGYNLYTILEETWKKVKKRDWKTNSIDGKTKGIAKGGNSS